MAAKESKTRGGAKETVALHGGRGEKAVWPFGGSCCCVAEKAFRLGWDACWLLLAATAATAGKENRMRALLFPSSLPLI